MLGRFMPQNAAGEPEAKISNDPGAVNLREIPRQVGHGISF